MLRVVKKDGLQCCKSDYKTQYCRIQPIKRDCPYGGVMTGVRMNPGKLVLLKLKQKFGDLAMIVLLP